MLLIPVKGWSQATASDNGPVCVGTPLILTGGPDGQANYDWTGPGGYTSTQQSPTVSASATLGMAGDYTLTINGGPSTATTTVTVNPLPLRPTINPSGPTTFCTGSTVTLQSSTGSSYLWSNSAITRSIIVGTSGSYTVQVTNAAGCQSVPSLPVVVTVNTIPATPTITPGGPTTFCTGGNVTLTSTAGPGYLWSNAATTQSITVSAAGSYTVQLSNSGCLGPASAATVITVNAAPTPTISAGGATTFCAGGNVTLTSSAGTTYLWSNSAATPGINVTTAGSYTVQVTDGTGCLSAASAPTVVTVNPLPTPTLTRTDPGNIICALTSVTFTGGGGTNYNFRVQGVSRQNSSSPTYTTSTLTNGQYVDVIVTNANGCIALSPSITNYVNSLPIIFITIPTACSADLSTYSLTVYSTGISVSSTLGTVTSAGSNVWLISGVPSTSNVTVSTTDGSCNNSLVVTAPDCSCPPISPPVSGGDRSYCTGGTIPAINATVSAGETVDWYSSLSAGTALRTGSLSYTPTAAGTYYAGTRNLVTGCVSGTRTAINLVMNPLPVTTLISSDPDNTFCAGTSVTFTATGGTNYNFRVAGVSRQNGSSPTFTTNTLTNSQVVDVIVTNANLCIATSTGITNTVNTLPAPNAGAGGIECDLNFNFHAVQGVGVGTWTKTTGPGTVTFAPNANSATATVTVSEYGTYTFTWTVINSGCSSGATITVDFNQQPVANPGTGGNSCGLETALNAVPSIGTGTWTRTAGPGTAIFTPNANTPNATVTVSSFGIYTFTWTEVNGTCSNSAPVHVTFLRIPAANAGNDGSSCNLNFILNATPTAGLGTGTWAKVTGPGNATFSPHANTPGAAVSVDAYGEYEFSWTEVNSTCESTDLAKVTFHNLPVVSAGRDTVICKGVSVQLAASGSGSFKWEPAILTNNPAINNPIVTPLLPTLFKVTLTDQFGCKNIDSIMVQVLEKPIANGGPDQVLDYVYETNMDAVLDNEYETGIWRLISGTGEIFDTTYAKTSVTGLSIDVNKFLWTVTNKVCPLGYDTITITVNEFLVPTLITPNMDGKNDYFVLRGLTTLGKTELTIFDRRGARVYQNLDYDNKWAGVDYNNNPLPDDTYFYVLRSKNGKSLSGYIVIRR